LNSKEFEHQREYEHCGGNFGLNCSETARGAPQRNSRETASTLPRYFAFGLSASACLRNAAMVFSEWLTRFADFCRLFRLVTLCRFAMKSPGKYV
jgi:hypothetical protein